MSGASMTHGLIARLRRDARGVTVIEFAIVAPVMCLMMMGAFDIAHTLYTRGQLEGVVQKTARDSGLQENADPAEQAKIDQKVRRQAGALVNNARIDITRRFYRDFTEAAAAEPEPYTDTNANGKCDAGEPYQDNNLNSTWDADGGNQGQGGAKDAVLYTVTMTYKHMFPLWKMLGRSEDARVVAQTVLRNQPYDGQASYGAPVVRNCP